MYEALSRKTATPAGATWYLGTAPGIETLQRARGPASDEIARRENVFCKISGMVTEADYAAWTPNQLRPYFDVVLEAFGPLRLMFGSDWPVCLPAGSWKEVLAAFTQAIGAQPIEAREKLLGETAAKFYRIEV